MSVESLKILARKHLKTIGNAGAVAILVGLVFALLLVIIR